MAANISPSPIQVVLNAESFVGDWKRQGGGGEYTDFFKGQDEDFVEHQHQVLAQMIGAKQLLERPDHPGVGFLKVSVRREALAKSHRPVKALFRPDRVVTYGAAAPGELVFAVTAEALSEIADEAASAEAETRYKEKKDKAKPDKPPKVVANPSRPRSEVGAIDRISLWSATDRRRFSVDQAIDWLADPRTGGHYLVELFEVPPQQGAWDLLTAAQRRLFNTFQDLIASCGRGVRAIRVALTDVQRPLLAVWLLNTDEQATVLWEPTRAKAFADSIDLLDFDRLRHQELLRLLDSHPLVKRIHLPPIVERQQVSSNVGAASTSWPVSTYDGNINYPRVAVVDGGLASCLDDWVVDRWPVVSPADESLDHGTFIGGLLVGARSINGEEVFAEADGCELVDVKLLPNENDPQAFSRYYGLNGPLGFFQELNDAVGVLRQRSGVRIFNLSANFETMAEPSRYNPLTAELDSIADAHDAIFVVSAGNADGADSRVEWPGDPVAAMATLASSTRDRVCSPAESVRNVSVGALNPPQMTHVIPHAPAAYSRRGPGLTCGLKPDFAHIGGSASKCATHGHGLWSIDPAGKIYSSAGTSYAAPLVAKTLAALANSIEGHVSRETLIALLVHHSHLPHPLANPAFGRVARDLVGFGIPMSSDQIISGADHQITMVFAARLKKGRRLEFGFAWPPSLTGPGGKCRGYAQITLVASSPLDPRAEGELVRVDLQAHMKQEGKSGAHLTCGWLPSKPADKEHLREVRLISEAMKWSPVKIYQWKAPDGQGTSTNWRLTIDHLSRDEDSMPDEGIPFTAIVTIADIEQTAPVFSEMRQALQAQGAQLEQIQTAARVSPRV
jgi:hypothetical protein